MQCRFAKAPAPCKNSQKLSNRSFRKSDMKFNQIEAYRAVMLAGSVTEAANFLNVSQPGVSRLIMDLERSIGFDLFDRLPGKITPTPEGEVFFKHIQSTFDGIRHLDRVAEEIANLKNDCLRIAAFPAAALELAPLAIQGIHKAYPDLKIRLEVRSSGKILELTSNKQIDIGLAAFPIEYPGVILERIYQPLCPCIVPASSPLASRRSVKWSDLVGETTLGISPELAVGKELRKVLSESDGEHGNLVEATSSFSICKLAEFGVGVGVVDPLTASVFKDSAVVAIPFRPGVKFGFAIVLPEYAARSLAVTKFTSILHGIAKSCLE